MDARSFAAAALIAAATLTSAVSHAQNVVTPQQKEQARNAMDEGDKKRDAGDLNAALAAYEKADGIMNVPSTAIEVARTQIALGKLLQAEVTLARIAKMDKKPGEPAPFTAARKTAETMAADIATRIPTVVVVPTGLEASQTAAVTIDGEPVADAATPRRVNPGPHKVNVKAGAADKTVDVLVAEKEAKTVSVDLKDQPKTAAPPPPQKSSLSGPKLMMYGGLGLAAVGIGVGAVTGLMSISQTSDLKDRCPNDRCAPGTQGDIDSAQTLGNISTVAFIVGGVGAAVGVVGFVLSGKEKTTEEAPAPPTAFRPLDVRAVLGPSYAGITGRF